MVPSLEQLAMCVCTHREQGFEGKAIVYACLCMKAHA